MIPSVETIEYGRRTIGNVREIMARFEAETRADGKESADAWRRVVFVLDRYLLGYEEGGCIITPFDKRLLDPKFRAMEEEIDARIQARE